MTKKDINNKERVVKEVNVVEMMGRSSELIRRGGIKEFSRGCRDFMIRQWYRLPINGERDYFRRRSDNEYRWEIIKDSIEEYETLVDIGCAEGYLTHKAAQQGLDATGYDVEENRIEKAHELWGEKDNLRFEKKLINPNNVDELPNSDVILLLTVQHHWATRFGIEKSTKMLKEVAEKCDILVYEPPGDRFLTRDNPIHSKESINKYLNYINTSFGYNISVAETHMVEFIDGQSRSDPLFIIDTSDYTHSD